MAKRPKKTLKHLIIRLSQSGGERDVTHARQPRPAPTMSHIEKMIHYSFRGSKPVVEFYIQTKFVVFNSKKRVTFSFSTSTIPQHGETGQSKGQIFALQR